ncbi:type IV pilus twitching motility protein PilT [Leucobacter denitrificans]|uniref:Type IV pilus twitching motility protein PilT n=1 Tax=Leucobacter denitrificans TaxID=683042 RepID=A0A7G9S7U3_9MICO|nr:type IV pilus twitching motility protein PilT [Leucobacter denitrificans]
MLDATLAQLEALGASDLHLSVGSPPIVRIDGDLTPIPGAHALLTVDALNDVIQGMLTGEQKRRFSEDLELDFAHSLAGVGRFRVNVYMQRQMIGAAFRRIDNEVRDLESLGVPAHIRDLAFLPRGLVLVTGPTGSGKSTTLASVLDIINSERRCHIVTVEDPIEFMHQPKRSLIHQREVGVDTRSFAVALKHVLRQDPDVILIGELRDPESISAALTAAETGHLVFATLHTVDAAQSIDRIVDAFPPHQQNQVRVQLSGSLKAVVSQTLLRRKQGGRVVATEVLRMTSAIANLIREGETHQIYSVLQSGSENHMHTLDQSLLELVRTGEVEASEAREYAGHARSFDDSVQSAAANGVNRQVAVTNNMWEY